MWRSKLHVESEQTCFKPIYALRCFLNKSIVAIYTSLNNVIKWREFAACWLIHICMTSLPGQALAFHLQASATGPYWDLLKQQNTDMS